MMMMMMMIPPNVSRFDSETAVSFIDNRRELLESLDRDGAPVRLRDIQLLEHEIQRAYQYMEQAKKLRAASLKFGEGLPDYDDGITRDRVCIIFSFSVSTVCVGLILFSVIISFLPCVLYEPTY